MRALGEKILAENPVVLDAIHLAQSLLSKCPRLARVLLYTERYDDAKPEYRNDIAYGFQFSKNFDPDTYTEVNAAGRAQIEQADEYRALRHIAGPASAALQRALGFPGEETRAGPTYSLLITCAGTSFTVEDHPHINNNAAAGNNLAEQIGAAAIHRNHSLPEKQKHDIEA